MQIHRKFWFHFFSRSYTLFELRNLAKMKDTTVFLVSATPLKPLNRISWNFVVIKDIMCRCAYPQWILIPFFSRSYALFELQNLTKMRDTTVFLVSATPLKPLNKPLKLCSNEGPNVYMCISTGNFDSIFFLGVTPFLNI